MSRRVLSNNEKILNSVKNRGRRAMRDNEFLKFTDDGILHDCYCIQDLFQVAFEKGIDLESKLPLKTRRNSERLEGRVSTFNTECMEQLPSGSQVIPSGTWNHRGIKSEELELYRKIVSDRLGL